MSTYFSSSSRRRSPAVLVTGREKIMPATRSTAPNKNRSRIPGGTGAMVKLSRSTMPIIGSTAFHASFNFSVSLVGYKLKPSLLHNGMFCKLCISLQDFPEEYKSFCNPGPFRRDAGASHNYSRIFTGSYAAGMDSSQSASPAGSLFRRLSALYRLVPYGQNPAAARFILKYIQLVSDSRVYKPDYRSGSL